MITTMLQGGLGNQLFQWAMGLAQAQRLGVELQLDLSRLNGGKPYRIFNLDLFEGINQKTVYGSTPTFVEAGFAYSNDREPVDGDVLLGYWQCEDYFRAYVPQVFRALRLKHGIPQLFTPYAIDQIKDAGAGSTFLGIRRGDYLLKQEYHGVLPLDYYERALRLVHNTTGIAPKVFVFSDDPAWCKDELKLPYEFEVLGSYHQTEGKSVGREDVDLYLMSLCHNAIIANSSFHWWGAWLGDFMQRANRVVVAPQQWFTDTKIDSSDVTPGRWLRI